MTSDDFLQGYITGLAQAATVAIDCFNILSKKKPIPKPIPVKLHPLVTLVPIEEDKKKKEKE